MGIDAIVGYLATFFSVVSLLPQAFKLYRTRRTHDISLPSYLLIETGALLWLGYGVMKQDIPIMVTNSIIGVIVFSIILLKLKYR